MKKILWISLITPYARARHAGGQLLCHVYDSIMADGGFEVQFISLAGEEELTDIEKSLKCPPKHIRICVESKKMISRWIDMESRCNLWNRNGGFLSNSREILVKKEIKALLKTDYRPDVIFLDWTEMGVLCGWIRKLFPESRIVCIEEDVSFLKRQRRYLFSHNKVKKMLHYVRYRHGKKIELRSMGAADLVVTNTEKDKELLAKYGISQNKVFVVCPYFNQMACLNRHENNDILFWGAMGRKENSDSAIWFINKVMPLLEDIDVRFLVVGSNPPEELLKLENDRVRVTGFVTDPLPYFEKSMCMAAPLVIGAGIKVKVLESFSAGIAVVTNHIGIEGIPAIPEKDYLHAEMPEEYASAILELYQMRAEKNCKYAENGPLLIQKYFDFDAKMSEYKRLLKAL